MLTLPLSHLSTVPMLSNPHADRIAMANALLGVIPADITLEEALMEKANNSL